MFCIPGRPDTEGTDQISLRKAEGAGEKMGVRGAREGGFKPRVVIGAIARCNNEPTPWSFEDEPYGHRAGQRRHVWQEN